MGIIKEFRDFAIKGNMVDMAVGIIIGGAFGAVVTSLVGEVMKPPLDYLVSKSVGSLDGWTWALDDERKFVVDISKFVTVVIGFFITALAVFLLVKAINKARAFAEREKAAEPPPATPEDILLLREIRDALKAKP
jgi:large conductance mechanosensitive channel